MTLIDILFPSKSISVDSLLSYPFSLSYSLSGYLNNVQKQLMEIEKWLNMNIGNRPKWNIIIDHNLLETKLCVAFLFKLEEDAIAFKLKWL